MPVKFKLLVSLGLFFTLILGHGAAFAATDTLDYAAAADHVTAVDSADLLAGLAKPIRSANLPPDFTKAVSLDPQDPDVAEDPNTCIFGLDDSDGVIGVAAYGVTADPKAVTATYSCASITYIAFDPKAMGTDPLGDFKAGAEADAASSEDGSNFSIEDVSLDDQPALLMTYQLTTKDGYVVVQVMVVQVGNFFVVGAMSVADTAEVDADQVAVYAGQLTYVGAVQLDAVATSLAE